MNNELRFRFRRDRHPKEPTHGTPPKLSEEQEAYVVQCCSTVADTKTAITVEPKPRTWEQ